jgi:hypothetical protein
MGMESVLTVCYPTIAVPTSEVEVEFAFFSYRACNKAPDLGSVSKMIKDNGGALP